MDRPSPVPSPAGLVVKKGLNNLVLDIGWNARAVVPYSDFDPISETFGPSNKSRFKAVAAKLRLALGSCVEAVRDQVEEDPSDLLGKYVHLAGGRVE